MADPLGRIGRTAVAVCLLMAALAWAFAGPAAALAVLGGGLLSAVSFASLASGVSAMTATFGRAAARPPDDTGDAAEDGAADPAREAEEPQVPGKTARPRTRTLLKVALRYALLVLLAYVMIARLRLHPVGVLAGVSSVVAAIAVEAVRILVKKS